MASKGKKGKGGNPQGPGPIGFPSFPSERELIIIARSDAGLRVAGRSVSSIAGADVTPMAEALKQKDVTIVPLFGETEERLIRERAALSAETGEETPDLSVFYKVFAPEEKLEDLCEGFAAQDGVEAAYIAPPAEPAVIMEEAVAETVGDVAPPATPNFVARQSYLNPAPAGVDARAAWRLPGGGGQGTNVIDIEGAWRFTHEDLRRNSGGLVGGTASSNLGWRNHGTAVIGVIGADRNTFGCTGISPEARVSGISIFNLGVAAAIRRAADRLRAGDIILIELHRPGPRFNFQSRSDQRGYIAVEWWPAEFDAIRYAAARGVIVVGAAGNGAENLDDPIYDRRPAGFPTSWSNSFRRGGRDSRAILVGAGAPPPGTHGRNHGPDRSRLGFSNFGAAVDAQGWGREVTTPGYGDLQGGSNEDLWYTDRFSGTSSASPVVVGSLACTQGLLRAHRRPLLNWLTARNLLRATGSPQTDAPGRPRTQRIGNRPNLRQIISRIIPTRVRTVPLYRYWNPRATDHFYTTNWRELGRGRHGWRLEGIQGWVFPTRRPGTVPLYRYWNPRIADHFYTTNWRELGRGRYGYRYEGVQCWVFARRVRGTVPLYRYWNGRIGDHFYTTNWRELGRGRHGYRYEGVQCYVAPTRTSIPSAGAPEAEEPLEAPEFLGAPDVEEALETVEAENIGAPSEFVGDEIFAEEGIEEPISEFGEEAPETEPEEEGEPISSSFSTNGNGNGHAPDSFTTEETGQGTTIDDRDNITINVNSRGRRSVNID